MIDNYKDAPAPVAQPLTPAQRHADELLRLLTMYRKQVPLGYQPAMTAHVVDDLIAKIEADIKEGGAS